MNEIEITIHDVAFGGSGVGRLPDGKIIFVPFTLAGETVRVGITRSTKGFCEGECLEVLKPSPHRISPSCSYFGTCGGCQYQHMAYEEQVRIKEKQVKDTLGRIGGFRELPSVDLFPASQIFGYRNKITVHSGRRGELGFFARDQRTIVDIEKCEIADEVVQEKFTALRKSSSRPRHATLVDQNQRIDRAEGVFSQVHSSMGDELLRWIENRFPAEKDPAAKLLDFYCGAGFFALGLAERFGNVTGVDQNPNAIHYATLEAKQRGHPHARFFSAPVEEKVEWFLEETIPAQTVILVDPPREGLNPEVIHALLKKPCSRLFYVSCDPATQARDLKKLVQIPGSGYTLQGVAVFDMFPQTAQIEVIAELKSA